MTAFDLHKLRDAFASFTTGVTVVTAVNEAGKPVGFTANSYTSVSLKPPLLLVCPARTLSSFDAFQSVTYFAVNILAEGQENISNIFASSTGNRFTQIDWCEDSQGCPLIDGAAASFSCMAVNRVDAGDHIILVGQITAFEDASLAGLGYNNSGYFNLETERRLSEQHSVTGKIFAGAIIEYCGKILMEKRDGKYLLPCIAVPGRYGAVELVTAYLEQLGLEARLGPVYSVFEGRHIRDSYLFYRAEVVSNSNPDGNEFVPLEEVASLPYVSKAVSSMMRRYVLERARGVFGLYVGDEEEGEVHMFGEGTQS